MDNHALIERTQRLYQGIIDAEIPALQHGAVAKAIRARTPWAALAADVKLALMKMAVHSQATDTEVIDLPAESVRTGRGTPPPDDDGGGEPEAA